ncbi:MULTISPECIES: FAD:protein FMN transferase [Furfurilactobacillus]|uniref:FAD:protein FMN transferase n=1 Tax=Furfurilactobacillus milii TaxID=2888272 RepID=A0ABT6DAX0_9LACO|nr:FAD:protein FMN transferase [Furfurilactobacillus milii]MCF6161162.1 FAD:protein FMN transferase [Furfurilactobacillus milii]MCF6163583.1 FAD:protein FMN transferase [Furfurilactobacillus milii]MDF9913870.1 FAD:protein FMN transferase [Furfurilactobacillus milii]
MSNNVTTKKYVSQFEMFGTVISLTLFKRNPVAVEVVYDYLQDADRIFSANLEDSLLMKINRQAGMQPVQVPRQLYDLIKRGVVASRKYRDSFNVLIGPLVKLWRIGFDGQQLPAPSDIKARLQLIKPDDVLLNDDQQTVYLTKRGMELDLGAIAKGYFADQIIDLLQSNGLKTGIVNLGGNVQLFGCNPLTSDGRWHVGIRNPQQPTRQPLTTISTVAKSVVTSGIDERYFIVDGHRYHHILSPLTGYPIDNDLASVTIVTPESTLAEILTTVCFFAGSRRGLELVDHMTDVEAVFVTRQNKILMSRGLER